ICTPTAAFPQRRQRARVQSTMPLIRAIRCRRSVARSARANLLCMPAPLTRAPPAVAPTYYFLRRARSDHATESSGPVTVRLWIASDAPDTDFTAKLIDVYPPNRDFPQGFAMNLTEGLLRVRYRDSWERPAPMVPGEVYAITIELFPVANLFCRGHRLRLDIWSSNFPHFDVNPNSGEQEGAWRHPRIARNRIFAQAARPSHILLPVIPPGERAKSQ